jgi:signal transduction histidine kinase
LQNNGNIEWEKIDSLKTSWVKMTRELFPDIAASDGTLFCRYQLPDIKWDDAAIYIEALAGEAEIYLNQWKIFSSFGHGDAPSNKYDLVRWWIVKLPVYDSGQYLYMRIKLPDPRNFEFTNLLIGSNLSFYREIFIKKELDQVVLGFLFIFTGFFSFLISIVRRHSGKAMGSFSFAILTLGGGGMLISGASVRFLFLDNPFFWYYLNGLAQFIFPVGIFLFYEKIFGAGYKYFFRRVWQFFLILAIILISLEILNVISFPDYFQYFIMLFIVATISSMGRVLIFAYRGNVEARIFSIGFFLFGFFGVRDMLMGLGVLSSGRPLWYWGMLIFVACLIYILEQQFSRAQTKLKIYSKELEAKSEQLADYSKTLEQKVKERTLDLENKNKELNITMQELKETQQQLIIKEKMASLGNLVAGVAHEINNPIGAIHSSSDLVHRSIEKITTIINQFKSREDLNNNPQFEKSVQNINRNNRIILEASRRVAYIVKSLKTFARLDEASYKKVNIQEGLDSTLELLYHEYKNKVKIVKEYGEIPEIYCYANELNQVFMNLISNAVEAISSEGVITIRTYCDEENIIVEISDTGGGIPQENLTKIFDPGFTTKGVGVGTGLGLSISHNIIKKHNGRLQVKSEVGKGTTFTVNLPEKEDEKPGQKL